MSPFTFRPVIVQRDPWRGKQMAPGSEPPLRPAILSMNRGGDGSSPGATRATQDMGTSRPHPGSWA
ncbi:MAG: hypothetical protein NT154_44995, partial [Verrucomicrobia bacterium]|nr:hypothetical protein [Verrucomicrobiota bacterium]